MIKKNDKSWYLYNKKAVLGYLTNCMTALARWLKISKPIANIITILVYIRFASRLKSL